MFLCFSKKKKNLIHTSLEYCCVMHCDNVYILITHILLLHSFDFFPTITPTSTIQCYNCCSSQYDFMYNRLLYLRSKSVQYRWYGYSTKYNIITIIKNVLKHCIASYFPGTRVILLSLEFVSHRLIFIFFYHMSIERHKYRPHFFF